MQILLDAAFESSRRAIRNNTSDNFSQPFGFLCTCQDTHSLTFLSFLCECVFPPWLCRLKFIMTGRRVDVKNESKTRLKGSKQAVNKLKVKLRKAGFSRKKHLISYSCHLSPFLCHVQWRKKRPSVWRFLFSFTSIECHTIKKNMSFLICTRKVFLNVTSTLWIQMHVSTRGTVWETRVNFFINVEGQRKGENKRHKVY